MSTRMQNTGMMVPPVVVRRMIPVSAPVSLTNPEISVVSPMNPTLVISMFAAFAAVAERTAAKAAADTGCDSTCLHSALPLTEHPASAFENRPWPPHPLPHKQAFDLASVWNSEITVTKGSQ